MNDEMKAYRRKESSRVSAHRKLKQEQGFRNISFLVSPEEYQLIEAKRAKYGLSTRELLVYYASGQYERDRQKYETFEPEIPSDLPPEEFHERSMQQEERLGHAFRFDPDCRDFLIASLKVNTGKMPDHQFLDVEALVDFETLEEAFRFIDAGRLGPRKRDQLTLFSRARLDEFDADVAPHWYIPILHLNRAIPNVSMSRSVDAPESLKTRQQAWFDKHYTRTKPS